MSAPSIHHDDGHGHGDHAGDGHGHHGSRFIQHHYDDAKHQFDAGKLGIWLFLTQEVLFFSALFVAYIVYRTYHPEIFEYAHHYLDTKMGAINTAVLILSSLSAAWAVRAAQLNQRKLLIALLGVTIACALAFLGIKYVEYTAKIDHGTLFGERFRPHESPNGTPLGWDDVAKRIIVLPSGHGHGQGEAAGGEAAAVAPKAAAAAAAAPAVPDRAMTEAERYEAFLSGPPPEHTNMFFSIYFAMTGLHGIHVLAGVFVFIWLLLRAIRGDFTSEYFGPIDYAALYWHLVDLIWIFLFPLLYLIH